MRKSLTELLHNPGVARMLCYMAVKDSPPVMRNDKEAVENAQGKRRHGEEVHRGDCLTMIAQKCRPSPGRLGTPRRPLHPLQYGSFGYIEAQHLQLAVNARRAPGWIFNDHAKEEIAQLLADTFLSGAIPMPRKPRPVELESCSMPANDGLGLNKNWRLFPSRPEPPQRHPTICHERQTVAEDACASRRRAVAVEPDFPKADHDESKRIG